MWIYKYVLTQYVCMYKHVYNIYNHAEFLIIIHSTDSGYYRLNVVALERSLPLKNFLNYYLYFKYWMNFIFIFKITSFLNHPIMLPVRTQFLILNTFALKFTILEKLLELGDILGMRWKPSAMEITNWVSDAA